MVFNLLLVHITNGNFVPWYAFLFMVPFYLIFLKKARNIFLSFFTFFFLFYLLTDDGIIGAGRPPRFLDRLFLPSFRG
jgi:hypothetical protein